MPRRVTLARLFLGAAMNHANAFVGERDPHGLASLFDLVERITDGVLHIVRAGAWGSGGEHLHHPRELVDVGERVLAASARFEMCVHISSLAGRQLASAQCVY